MQYIFNNDSLKGARSLEKEIQRFNVQDFFLKRLKCIV